MLKVAAEMRKYYLTQKITTNSKITRITNTAVGQESYNKKTNKESFYPAAAFVGLMSTIFT